MADEGVGAAFNVSLRFRSFQIAADLAHQKVVDFTMPRDRGGFTLGTIDIDAVIPSLAQQGAAVTLQVAEQVAAFHRS
jgi:hypothetical protein